MSTRTESRMLEQIPLFKDCDPVALQVMAFAAHKQEYSSGDDIITQGKTAFAAFVIISGRAKILSEDQLVAVAEPGAFLGEVAMLSGGDYSITATASGTVVTAQITQRIFLRVAREYPDFCLQVYHNLGNRLAGHMHELENIQAMLNLSRNFSDLG